MIDCQSEEQETLQELIILYYNVLPILSGDCSFFMLREQSHSLWQCGIMKTFKPFCGTCLYNGSCSDSKYYKNDDDDSDYNGDDGDDDV